MGLMTAGCGNGSNGSGTQTSAPSGLSYPDSAITATVGAAIASDNPTVTGTVDTYSISPQLPAGLSLSTSLGTISGTPTATSAKTSYTVTASNSSGSTTTSITILVNPAAPAKLTYPQTSILATVGTAIVTDTPTVTGTVSSYTIDPALPAGLSIDAASGAISGTPTAPSAEATYTVTAANGGGNTTAQIQIKVLSGPSPLVELGHTYDLQSVHMDAANVISEGVKGHWVLWDYATAAIIASGDEAETKDAAGVAVGGQIAVVSDGTNLSIYSTATGALVGTVPAGNWWKLASDGSYIAVGSAAALTVFSPAGLQDFARTGDYSKAIAFPAPGQVQVALGAAGSNVIESLAVPSGSSTLTAPFLGNF